MKIAIIGTGISGLGIAHLLFPHHELTIYEKNAYIGGHSRTMSVKTKDGHIPVDTGFIVFNERNYPHLTALFKHLDIPVAKTNMSFGVDIGNGWLEYGTYHKLAGLFAQKRNVLRPAYLNMIKDILSFNKRAVAYLDNNTTLTLGELLDEMKMGEWFREYYLLAMGAAIWSTPATKMTDFPALTFLKFFDNHGLLTIADHPQWYTVIGGSKEYVSRITKPFMGNICIGIGVKSVTRRQDHIEIIDTNGNQAHYDQVIFACHSDQALKLLQNPSDQEQKALSAIRYQSNEMILHTDTSFMPKRKKAWSSWVYQANNPKEKEKTISLSYWMNNLQPLATNTPIIVTLNPHRSPKAELIHDRYTFEHPVFDTAAIKAQKKIPDIQGKDRIWYCGAWQRYGFHEDGLLSAVNIAKSMGIEPEWM
jgi:uncharacterized protein